MAWAITVPGVLQQRAAGAAECALRAQLAAEAGLAAAHRQLLILGAATPPVVAECPHESTCYLIEQSGVSPEQRRLSGIGSACRGQQVVVVEGWAWGAAGVQRLWRQQQRTTQAGE
ncbi:hypothetical protein [Halorhodospira abdelmalekii]|uniref:hypothetical protein n=1 Tax=Halorhodospira abdelmalekii TaxID=421629 RepID=UPI00190302D8|nr:hypothetical protein [Halorhodospira abdelmalekii]